MVRFVRGVPLPACWALPSEPSLGVSHPNDGLVQVDAAGRTLEHGAWTEAEHTTVGGDQPVAVASRCAGHSDDGLVEGRRSGRTVEGSVVAEHAPAGGDQLIPATGC